MAKEKPAVFRSLTIIVDSGCTSSGEGVYIHAVGGEVTRGGFCHQNGFILGPKTFVD